MKLKVALAVTVALLGIGGQAHAGVVSVPEASYSDQLAGLENPATGSGFFNSSFTLTTLGWTAGFSVGPEATLTLTDNNGGGPLGPSDQDSMNYYFAVVGPTTSALIPVDLAYNVTSTTSLSTVATIDFLGLGTCGGSSSAGALWCAQLLDETGSGTVTESVSEGEDYGIALTGQIVGSGSGELSIDPILSIDSSFASVDPNYLEDYSIVLSAGFQNGPAATTVPEPLTLSLFGAGLAGAVAMRRRQKKA